MDTPLEPLVKGRKEPTQAARIVMDALKLFALATLSNPAEREQLELAAEWEVTYEGMLIRVRQTEPFWIVCEAGGR